MDRFYFITDDTLRGMIERDKNEMDKCLSENLFKSVLVLAGSIIEAILVDYFLAFPPSNGSTKNIARKTLAQLIELAEKENLISTRAYEISTIVRNYRNLIHPGKEYRLQEKVNIHSASVAAHLVEIIIDEIGENYSKKLGYKAEAAIEKVKIDPNSTSIFENMVGQMSLVERIKLFRLIPKICQEETLEEIINNLVLLHKMLSKRIPKSVIQEEAERVQEYLNHRTRDETLLHLRFFVEHLDIIDEASRSAVLKYLLGLLGNCEEQALISIEKMHGFEFSRYINTPDLQQRLIKSMRTRLRNGELKDDEIFLDILESMFIQFSPDYINEVKKQLAMYSTERSLAWIDRIENFIPF